MRQFYTEPRTFRINAKAAEALQKIDTSGQYEISGLGNDYRFIQYSNAMIMDDATLPDGSVRHKRAMFDITVTAEKKSPFSRAAQNELIKELYSMGFFDPNNTLPARTALDAMDFEGKDKLMQEIEQNSNIMQQLEAAMGMVKNLSMMDPGIAQMAMQQGLIAPEQMDEMQQQAAPPQNAPKQEGTPEERAAKAARGGDNSLAAQARVAAANRSIPR
jgi:hypothetical protein